MPNPTTIMFKFERETKNTCRYMAVGADGLPAFAPAIDTIYVQKSAMPASKIAKTLTIVLSFDE